MNERIRELYEQARLQAKSIDADLDPQGWMDLYHKKFAELIVRECADKCLAMAYVNPGPHHYAAMIKEHFGVE
jgi:hypothetical protein